MMGVIEVLDAEGRDGCGHERVAGDRPELQRFNSFRDFESPIRCLPVAFDGIGSGITASTDSYTDPSRSVIWLSFDFRSAGSPRTRGPLLKVTFVYLILIHFSLVIVT